MDDEALLRAARQGDRRAFDQLFARYYRRTVNFASRFVHDEAQAEELAQEAFVKVLQHLDQEFAGRQFARWLFKVVRNLALNHQRGQRRLELVGDDQKLAEHQAELAEVPTQDVRLEQQQWADQGLAALNADQREVFLLRTQSGLTYAEIAEVIERPVGTVRSRLHHAVQTLRSYAKENRP